MKYKTAFLFAGQGAQFVGMGSDFFSGLGSGAKGKVSKVGNENDNDGEKAKDHIDIYKLMRKGPAEELNKTINAQPAIFLHGLAVAEEFRQRGFIPDCVAGFSLGEIPALVFAGVLSAEKGLELVNVRAGAMQKCCEENQGTMVAVMKLSAEQISKIAGAFKNVWLANYNSPEQTVCSCSVGDVEAFCKAVAAEGGKAIRLKVSGAFHCKHMINAGKAVDKWLSDNSVQRAVLPVYSNWIGSLYFGDYKKFIVNQIQSPVLWQTTIENMLNDGVRAFVEVGPGQVLAGLVRKIAEANGVADVKIFSADSMGGVGKALAEIV